MKVLVANRGEIALRVIRALRDLRLQEAVVFSPVDRKAPHVLLSREIHPVDSYLNQEQIIQTALAIKAKAIHPGYGFLAENAEFARRCREAGLIFLGPSPEAMDTLGHKLKARKLAESLEIPVIPGTSQPISKETDLLKSAEKLGFPLLFKAALGGGGKGMRKVYKPEELKEAWRVAQSEAQSYFSSPEVYLEKFLEAPRHIEVQILGDKQGNYIHLGERECSLQRRHQKVFEEAPSPVVTPEERQRLGQWALRLVQAVNYDSAGTVEFLRDAEGNYYFLEVNTRIQVEHPVTEMITGIDLVVEQIRCALSEPLRFSQKEVYFSGHAMECRIYAEDPQKNFIPSPGVIRYLHLPEGPGIRNDVAIYEGYEVPLDYDPLLGKLIVQGTTRKEALFRLKRALQEYRIAPNKTTLSLFRSLLEEPFFIQGDFSTMTLMDYLNPPKDPLDAKTKASSAAFLAAYHHQRGKKKLITPPAFSKSWLRWQ